MLAGVDVAHAKPGIGRARRGPEGCASRTETCKETIRTSSLLLAPHGTRAWRSQTSVISNFKMSQNL